VIQRFQEILDENERARADLLSAVEGLSQEELSARPSPDRWSIGEILHHLQLIEAAVLRLLEKQTARAERTHVPPDTKSDSLLHSLDHFAIPSAADKIVAPDSVSPERGRSREVLHEGLRASRAALLAAAARASEFDLGALHFPHPVLGRLNMYQWILYIGQHERRHLAQIQRIRGAS
jgi:hypothetical protein